MDDEVHGSALWPAELLTWATGREISKADAMRCARREPGRSWQAIPSELTRLGEPRLVFPTQASVLPG